MPKFDISSEELKNIKKEKSTGIDFPAPKFDFPSTAFPKTTLGVLEQLDKINNDRNALLQAAKGISCIHAQSVLGEEIEKLQASNWQASVMDPIETQFNAMQGINSYAHNLDIPNLAFPKADVNMLEQINAISSSNNMWMKSIADARKMYTHPVMPETPDWQKFVDPLENLSVMPQITNWQANMIDPLEKQLGAMQDLNISLAKQNLALQTQSELIQKQLAESQKANALKEKELEDGKKSRKIDRRWVVRSFLVSLLTLIATLLFGYYSLNIKPQAQYSDEKLAPSENVMPLGKNEQPTKDTVESVLKHKPNIPLPTDDEVMTKDDTDKNTSE